MTTSSQVSPPWCLIRRLVNKPAGLTGLLVNHQGYSRDNSFLEMVVDIILELKKANPSLVYGEFANSKVAFWDCSFLQLKSLQLTGIFFFYKQQENNVFIYANEVQRVASHFNLQECHKLELIKETSGTTLRDGGIMASNGPSNSQHIRSQNNWVIYHFTTDCFCVMTTKVHV